MKLKSVITIDMEADDFVAAAEHQRQMEAIIDNIHNLYPQAILEVSERRPRGAPRSAIQVAQRRTGSLHQYEEAS